MPVGIDGQLLIIPVGCNGTDAVFLFDRSNNNEPYRRLADTPPLRMEWEFARRVSEPFYNDSTEMAFMVCDCEEYKTIYECTYHKLKKQLLWEEYYVELRRSLIYGQLAVCDNRLLIFEKDGIEGIEIELHFV